MLASKLSLPALPSGVPMPGTLLCQVKILPDLACSLHSWSLQFPALSKERLFWQRQADQNYWKKSLEEKLEFGLSEDWVLLTTEARLPGQNFTFPNHKQKMYVFMT